MFTKTETETKLDAEINALLDKLKDTTDSDEYSTIVERLTKLHKLKTEERPKRISPDTALAVAANIVGILILISFESEHVIKARSAIGFIMKPR